MKIDRSRRRTARIEMIPLIDVIFLLLITFILFSMTMTVQRGIPLSLPDAATAQVHRDRDITISVDALGTVYLDGAPLADEQLAGRLVELLGRDPERTVVVAGDKGASYERIIFVMDAVRSAGIGDLSLETTWE